jgi:hypothetical protein
MSVVSSCSSGLPGRWDLPAGREGVSAVLVEADLGDAAAQRRPAGPVDNQGGLADHDQIGDRQ